MNVPSDGNVYQGLHSVRAELEATFAELLAAHGVMPDPEPETQPEPTVAPEGKPEEPPAT